MADGRIETYREFWPYYLRQHAQPATRTLHYVGTAIAIACLATLLLSAKIAYLAVAIVAGYLFAWIGHFWIERNRPATFTYPLWSLASDFRMFFAWIGGSLEEELKRAGVGDPGSDPRQGA